VSFDGGSKDDVDDVDNESDECRIKYCLVSHSTLDKMSVVIRDQLDTSDQDLSKLHFPDIASISPLLPSSSLSQLM